MSNELMVPEGRQVAVVPDSVIADYLKSLGNNLKEEHRTQFIQICKAFNLNPFIREVYGIPYGDKFSVIVGYEVYLKRAENSGMLSGWRAWTEGEGNNIKGCVEITRKDWTAPFFHEVYFDEYNQNNAMWKSKGRTMIKKVAIAQGFRMAFPVELGGLPYTADELPDKMTTIAPPATAVSRPAPPKASAPTKQQHEDADVSGEMGIAEQVDLALDHLTGGDMKEKQNLLLEASRGGKPTGAFLTYAKLHEASTSKPWLHKIMEYLQAKIQAAPEDLPAFEGE